MELKEQTIDVMEMVVKEYQKKNEVSISDINEKLEVKVFPVKESFHFVLLEFEGVPIASLLDLDDNLIVSYYGNFEYAESKDDLH